MSNNTTIPGFIVAIDYHHTPHAILIPFSGNLDQYQWLQNEAHEHFGYLDCSELTPGIYECSLCADYYYNAFENEHDGSIDLIDFKRLDVKGLEVTKVLDHMKAIEDAYAAQEKNTLQEKNKSIEITIIEEDFIDL